MTQRSNEAALKILEHQYDSFINLQDSWDFFRGLAEYTKTIEQLVQTKPLIEAMEQQREIARKLWEQMNTQSFKELQTSAEQMSQIAQVVATQYEPIAKSMQEIADLVNGAVISSDVLQSLNRDIFGLARSLRDSGFADAIKAFENPHPLRPNIYGNYTFSPTLEKLPEEEKRITRLAQVEPWGAWEQLPTVKGVVFEPETVDTLLAQEMEAIREDKVSDDDVVFFRKSEFRKFANRVHTYLLTELRKAENAPAEGNVGRKLAFDDANGLLEDVQDKNVAVSNLLRKAKVIAHKLDGKEFLQWIDAELNGYDNETVPDYRMVRGQVKALNPYRGWVPVIFGDAEAEKTVSTGGAGPSVSEIEELLNNDSPTYEMPYPDSVAAQMLSDAPIRTKAVLVIGRGSLVGILNAVRNRLFDWVLSLEKENPEHIAIGKPKSLKHEKDVVDEKMRPRMVEKSNKLEFDDATSTLFFADVEIVISKQAESDAHELLRTVFKDRAKTWNADEVLEDWQFALGNSRERVPKNKVYQAGKAVNRIVAQDTTIKDFLTVSTKAVSITKKYLTESL
jgi:hypothetical protein